MESTATVKLITDSWSAVWANVAPYLWQVVVALILFIVGVIIAKAVEKVVVQVLKLARFDVLSEKSGIATILAKGEIKHTLSELLGVVIYWLLILVVVIITLNAVNLQTAGLLDAAAKYAGQVVLAVFVLILGLFFASLIGSIVRTSASNAGIAMAKNLGQISQVVIIVFTILTVLPMVGVDTEMLNSVIQITLAAVGLGMALAFGLGSKEIAGKVMQEIVEKWKRK